MRLSTLIVASFLAFAAAKIVKNEKKCSRCPAKGGNKTASQEKANVANPEAKKEESKGEEANQNSPKATPGKSSQKSATAAKKEGEKNAAEVKTNGAVTTAFSAAAVGFVAVLALAAC
jgi:hypothetical protein